MRAQTTQIRDDNLASIALGTSCWDRMKIMVGFMLCFATSTGKLGRDKGQDCVWTYGNVFIFIFNKNNSSIKFDGSSF